MKKVLQIITLVAIIIGAVISISSLTDPVQFYQIEGNVDKIVNQEESFHLWFENSSREYVVYYEDLPQQIDIQVVENDFALVKFKESWIETEKTVICQLVVNGVEIFSTVQAQLTESSLVAGGFAFSLCVLAVCLLLIMVKNNQEQPFDHLNFEIRSPSWVGEMGYFFVALAGAPSIYIVLAVILQKTSTTALLFLLTTFFLMLLAFLQIYVYKWEFFRLQNDVYTYRKPFKKSVDIPREKVFAVLLEERKYTNQFYVNFLDQHDNVIFRFLDDGTCLKHNYFVDSLIAYDIPLRIKEDGEIITVDYDELQRGE